MKFKRRIKTNKKSEAFVDHFRFLGLRRGECRTHVIRLAAQARSIELKHVGVANQGDHLQDSSDDVLRAKIAVATYRLLDPRERADLYERVQLCYPIDREDSDVASTSTVNLIDQMPKVNLDERRIPTSSTGVQLMRQPLIDEAIEGKSPSDEEHGADRSLNSSESASSEPSMDERRNIVRLLRDSEEATLRGLSPLGWLRSRLGI